MQLADLPPHARVWVYQSTTEFTPEQHSAILVSVRQFVAGWASHGTPLRAAVEILHKRFIVVGVDEAHAMASGCSIDKSVHFMQSLEREFGLKLFDRMQVAYWQGETVKTASMHEFGAMLADGRVAPDTVVFNNLVDTVASFGQQWQVPVGESWHARLLPA